MICPLCLTKSAVSVILLLSFGGPGIAVPLTSAWEFIGPDAGAGSGKGYFRWMRTAARIAGSLTVNG
ncbi:hypothetical protein GCWU000341_00978 [Oribacterium sp. oral taxon 078 str. F0262]|nr:hypothetical protein GCWU000341_00978 [Oribacterium sp. oral taxon 078 str. F0262]